MSEHLDPRFELRIGCCDGIPTFVAVFKLDAVPDNPRHPAGKAATMDEAAIRTRAVTNNIESVDADFVGK
jgi:hypothetical protein